MDDSAISRVVDEVVRQIAGKPLVNTNPGKTVAIGISNRHGHLTAEHVEILFGAGKRLTSYRALKQPDQFATNETLSVATNKGILHNVRLIGPERKYSQIELSRTDAFALGLNPPVRQSGQLEETASCVLIGPAGSVVLRNGVILSGRHLHCHTSEGQALRLADKQLIKVRIPGPRGAVLENVLVRVGDIHKLELHLDTDEGNALGVKSGDMAELLI